MNRMIASGIRAWMVFMIFSLACLQVSAQDEVIGHVKTALKTGSSKELTKYVNTTVEVNIDGEISSYSKMQAEFIFKDFFKSYPPTDFVFNHQGASKGGLTYAIGKYSHNDGSFMVWLRMKEFSGKYLIYEMNFIKE